MGVIVIKLNVGMIKVLLDLFEGNFDMCVFGVNGFLSIDIRGCLVGVVNLLLKRKKSVNCFLCILSGDVDEFYGKCSGK